MRKEILATGRTVEEAIDNGCAELGITRGVDDYDHEIVDMPSKGFLGIGSKPAKVRIWVELPDENPAHAPKAERKPEAKPERKPAPEKKAEKKVEEKAEAKAEEPEAPEKTVDFGNKPEIVLNYVKSIVVGMGLDEATVSVDTEGQNIKVQIDGDDAGITIGRRGETLDAIQYLAGLAANRGEGDFARVVVNSGTYRAKRRHTLEQLAMKLAVTAVRTGKSTTLEPMNPYERRIIHSAVAQVEGATSSSIGEEPNRCVVVSSTNPRPSRGDGERRQRGGRNDRNSRGGRDRRDNRGRRPKAEPYQESGVREVAPAEAQNHSLYGKVEI
ncbi:MAG: protein jag [Oscillospiraceae bacterium]|nr:protein jag [Oscillospiraceae bacterium]